MCKTPLPVCLPSRCSRSKWSRRAAAGFSHCLQTSSCHIWSSCCARLTALSSQWPCRQAFLMASLTWDVICACAFVMHGCNLLKCPLFLSKRLLCTHGFTLLHLCVDLCSCSWDRPCHYMLSAGVLCGVRPVASDAVCIMSKLYAVVAPRCR